MTTEYYAPDLNHDLQVRGEVVGISLYLEHSSISMMQPGAMKRREIFDRCSSVTTIML
jgi:hypothetical protein